MNIGIVLSGGSGKRFGDNLPKQYHNLNGKPVINYAVDSALKAKKIDEIVLVIDKDYTSYVEEINNPRIHCVPNGKERVDSVINALTYINQNYSCENIIILQAVSPMVTPELIDEYFDLLGEYDVVTTAEKCVGEIFKVNEFERLDRGDYYFCHSPEAFKFKELYGYIDKDSKYTELIYHYKNEPKICFYTKFKNNVKITYKSDILYCESLLAQLNEGND